MPGGRKKKKRKKNDTWCENTMGGEGSKNHPKKKGKEKPSPRPFTEKKRKEKGDIVTLGLGGKKGQGKKGEL